MKQLTCEMCGSTDLIKQDGVFVCQTCGCKYSVEEAKKMMIEGTVEVTGTVSLDDSTVKQNKVRNFLDMANAALESGDYKGTLDYCDRALETDINSYEAWIIKAKIIGCGASPKDMKISQAIVAAKRAVELVPDAMKAEVADNLYRTIKEQINALLKIVHDSVGTIGGIDYTSDIHRLMMQWKDLLTDISCLSSVLMKEEINACEKLCDYDVNNPSESYRAKYKDNGHVWCAYCQFNNEISYGQSFQKALAEKIKQAEICETSAREKYWAEHTEQKQLLESLRTSAEAEVTKLQNEQAAIPEISQVEEANAKIAALTSEMKALGLFKGKEKKAIQSQIQELQDSIDLLNKVIVWKRDEIQKQIDEQISVISQVEAEFSKLR